MNFATSIRASVNGLSVRNTATIRALRRDYSKRLATSSAAEVLGIAQELLKANALRWFAYELIQNHREAFASLKPADIERLGSGIADWAAVDTFSCYIAGPAWHRGQIPDRTIQAWARSSDLWWRRAALVATVALNCPARGGTGDTARTLKICEMLVDDREDMVVKAMSWALRELAKRDPAAVRGFLAEHPQLAPRVVREVRNKLTTGLKNP